MRSFDFSPLYRSTVGFDQLQSLLDSVTRDAGQPSYPPYNIERTGEHEYRISMAVAGFAESDLNIEVKQNVLTISGKRAEPEQASYLYQGIAGRSFERRFQLADHVEVHGANLENGLLHVDLVRRVPEELKPRRIEISAPAKGTKTLEGNLATAAD
jgi:molecular chaperone IbpA